MTASRHDGSREPVLDDDAVPPVDDALLPGVTGEEAADPADRQPGTIDDDDALTMDVGTQPVGSGDPASDETDEGLDATEEAVRRQAEDRALGDDEDFIA